MEITTRSLWTLLHGMGFGALYLLACSGGLMELYRLTSPSEQDHPTRNQELFQKHQTLFLNAYLLTMVALAWAAVLTGTYLVYPWYRAVPPPATADLALFPQRLLLTHAATAGWHTFGMEWKEHLGWFAPIAITPVAFIFLRYGRDLKHHPRLRAAALGFCLVSFLAAGVAGFFGAMLDKYAPIQGGGTVVLQQEK